MLFPRIPFKQLFLFLVSLSFNDTGGRAPSGWGIFMEGEKINYVLTGCQLQGKVKGYGLDPLENGNLLWPTREVLAPRGFARSCLRCGTSCLHLAARGLKKRGRGRLAFCPGARERVKVAAKPSRRKSPGLRFTEEGGAAGGGGTREAARGVGAPHLR